MKRIAVVVMAGALVLALAGDAGAGKGKQQKVAGSIALPAPFYGSAVGSDGCFGGLHRRITTALQGQPNGVVGYHFEVDKKTWNKPFVLKATGGQGTVDLDLFLYSHVPPLEEWPDDPQNAGTPVSVDYNTREAGGEVGIVPPKTVSAIVCMYAGPAGHAGFNASFTYTAGKGVKGPK